MTLIFHPEIDDHEKQWITLQPEFVDLGYQFRPRFRPGWTPSWTDGSSRLSYEDSEPLGHRSAIDAVRLCDGTRVMIKMVSLTAQGAEEVRLTEVLGTEPGSPIVPVLGTLKVPCRPDLAFLVLQELVPWDARPFHRLDEALDFVKQMLSGLAFLHTHGVSHGDVASSNIMMDGLHLFEYEPHPAACWMQRANYALYNPLKQTVPLYSKFYFIDCGLSIYHSPPSRKFVKGFYGQDTTVPELFNSEWNDPFKVDLWSMGRFLLVYVVDEYSLDLLRPLVEALRQVDPNARIPASHALQFFTELVAQLSPEQLAAPITLNPQHSITKVLMAEMTAVNERNLRLSAQSL